MSRAKELLLFVELGVRDPVECGRVEVGQLSEQVGARIDQCVSVRDRLGAACHRHLRLERAWQRSADVVPEHVGGLGTDEGQ
jgi:hypothetical protein